MDVNGSAVDDSAADHCASINGPGLAGPSVGPAVICSKPKHIAIDATNHRVVRVTKSRRVLATVSKTG